MGTGQLLRGPGQRPGANIKKRKRAKRNSRGESVLSELPCPGDHILKLTN